jgi:adenylate cyclase
MAIDFEAEGLLQGTEGAEREARLRLLEELTEDGVALDELRQAVEDDRLALLPLEKVLEGEGRRYTVEEVAELADIDVDLLRRLQQALGFPAPEPGERAFTDEDVSSAKRMKAFRDAGIPEDGLLEVSRVIGMAMGQIAATNRDVVGNAMLQPGDTELDVGRRFAAVAKDLIPTVGPTLQYALALHLREQIRREAIGRFELATGKLPGAVEVTVAFADLVGFTRLGEGLPADELGGVTGRLSELAREVAQPPVRLVKLIGDAAMLVSPENDPLVDSTLSLVEAADEEGEEFPALRAGVARGTALPRGGDWYGHPVNLASRITEVARPGSVLCSPEAREAAGDRFEWSNAGSRRLKGIRNSVRLSRVRRAELTDS